MTPCVLVLVLTLIAADDVPARNPAKSDKSPRASTKDSKEKPKHSPYAPSLPYLTKEEEDRLDEIVERFMQYDIGRLQGKEGAQALKAFKNLGPEAIPSLVRGLNRAAMIEHSCPVVVIAQKLGRLLAASDDQELLEYVRDNIGSGVGRTRHAGVLQDLRFAVTLRKNAVASRAATVRERGSQPLPYGRGPAQKTPGAMSVSELADAASIERGPRLRSILIELEKRRGEEVGPALANAAGSYEKDIQKLGRELLDRHLARQSEAVVKEKLGHELVEIRKSATRVIAAKMPRLGGELIELLGDDKEEVRVAAHEALVKLSRGQDFGPAAGADREAISQAQAKWRSWWESKTTLSKSISDASQKRR
jgi:hypothetical protein